MTSPPETVLRRSLEVARKAVAAIALLVIACTNAGPSPSSALKPAWRAHLDGAVDGTPAVADGMVFAGSAGGELAAFELRTGARVWLRRDLGAISDSPAVDGGRVFVGTLTGHVRALSASDGTPVWDWIGPPNANFWSSPVVYRGMVIIGVASPYGDRPLIPGRIVALDERTGVERWMTCVLHGCASGDGVWSTVTIDGSGTAFVGIGNPDDGVLAFDPVTGRSKWLSGYADNGRDLDDGARPLIVASGGRALVVEASVGGSLWAFDALSGGLVWSRRLVEGSAVHGLIATPAYDGNVLYVPSASPPTGVFAVKPSDGSVKWRHATDEPVYSAPAARNGVVVFGAGAVFGDLTVGSLVEMSARDGHELGHFDTKSAVRSGPVFAGDTVVFGDYAGDLLAVNLNS
jgi:outer membrane protein assembly factor BamB